MRRTIVVAMTPPPERLIGKGGALPWHISEDLKHFKKVTLGHAVVMGRKTLDELKKPLPGRRNLVITRQMPAHPMAGVEYFGSLEEALAAAEAGGETDCMICGGAEIYWLALERGLVDRMVITYVEILLPRGGEGGGRPVGDRYFPAFDETQWRESERRTYQDEKVRLTFVTLDHHATPNAK
jgi:dihydrofolate reductase